MTCGGSRAGSHEALAVHNGRAELNAVELKHGVHLRKESWMQGTACEPADVTLNDSMKRREEASRGVLPEVKL